MFSNQNMSSFDLEAFEPTPLAESSSCEENYDIHSLFEPFPIADQQENVFPPCPASILSLATSKSDSMQLPWLGNPMSLKCIFESADIQVNTGAISPFIAAGKHHGITYEETSQRNTSTAPGATSSSTTGEDPPCSTSTVYMNQSGRWKQRFQELCAFRKEYDHCCVPSHWPQNPPLAQWVKRQRYQYKIKKEGQHSNMFNDREQILDEIGFVWDSHTVFWEERLNELHAFRDKHGHCNVPSRYSESPQLAVWAKCQRRQFKLLTQEDTHSNMTLERISKLTSVGFVFNPRKMKRKKTARSA